jgi:hypothetical protein
MPNELPPRPTVTDSLAWGTLVKSWAKGLKPIPTSLTDLVNQCTAANVGLTMPPYVTKLVVVQEPKTTFVLRLAPKEMIEEAENFLNAGGDYLIPTFYNRRYGTPLQIAQAEKLNFHAERSGDYTIGLCQ